MLFVADTSTLIALRKLERLDLCRKGKNQIIWPNRVTQELRSQKRKNQKILALLALHQVDEVEAAKPIVFTGISQTDADIISLASEWSGAVLSEDKLLRQKATKLRIPAFSVSTLILWLYHCDVFLKDECLARLQVLLEKRFLSQVEYRKILQGISP